MNILDTYVINTTDKLDLGLKPNEAFYIKKIDNSNEHKGVCPRGATYEVHYTYAEELITDGETPSK